MKIKDILKANDVRSLFFEYYEEVKKTVEELINESLINEACGATKIKIIDGVDVISGETIALTGDVYNDMDTEILYPDEYDVCLPKNITAGLKEKYYEKFCKIGLCNLPTISFDLFVEQVTIIFEMENGKEEEFMKIYFSDMAIENSDTMRDINGKLFRF